MKWVRTLAVPALLLCAGCFPQALGLNSEPKAPPPVIVLKPPVSPESVTVENYREKYEDLAGELDRAESQP